MSRRTLKQRLRCEYVIPPVKPGGHEHTVRCDKPWWPPARRTTKTYMVVLHALRHPAARESLEETGNRKERRVSKVAPAQLDRKPRRR